MILQIFRRRKNKICILNTAKQNMKLDTTYHGTDGQTKGQQQTLATNPSMDDGLLQHTGCSGKTGFFLLRASQTTRLPYWSPQSENPVCQKIL